MRRPISSLAVVAALVTASVALVSSTAALAGAVGTAPVSRSATSVMPAPGTAEADFVARINALRGTRGLHPLTVDAELTAAARSWSATMAGQGRIFHSSDLAAGISADWSKLGENVGVGGDVASLFQAFVDSPTHLANLVDPKYTEVGVGVVIAGDRMYTAHRFMGLRPTAPAPTVTPTTAAPVTVPSTTAPTVPPTTASPTTSTSTTAPPTTTVAPVPDSPKFGRLDRLRELIVG